VGQIGGVELWSVLDVEMKISSVTHRTNHGITLVGAKGAILTSVLMLIRKSILQ